MDPIDHGSPDHGRGDRVDGDAGLRELLARRLHEPDHGGLGRGVGAHPGVAFLARDGGKIEDPPVVVRLHREDRVFGHEKGAAQIDRRFEIEGFGRHLCDTRVGRTHDGRAVDHDVESAARAARGDRGKARLYLVLIGDVDGFGIDVEAFRGQLGDGCGRFLRADVKKGDLGTFAGEALDDGLADAVGATGDDSGLL